jgi:hypothetical protein
MLRSPAMRVLSLTGRRILDRVEIELARHGGKDNGKLPITYSDLIAFGIHDHAIGPGLREVEALGFVEIKRGIAGSAAHRKPNLFRLTYRPADGKPETNEWARVGSIEQASAMRVKPRQKLCGNRHAAPNPRWRKPPAGSLAETTSEGRRRKPPVTGLKTLAGGNRQYFRESLAISQQRRG